LTARNVTTIRTRIYLVQQPFHGLPFIIGNILKKKSNDLRWRIIAIAALLAESGFLERG